MTARGTSKILPRLVLILVLGAGTLVRVCYARRAVVFEGDENTTALMALHIARGQEFPLYFHGQHYMGGIGPYVIAGVFLLSGPSDMAVSVGMLPFSWLWMLALYLLFGRLIGRWAGVTAAAVVALGPPSLVRLCAEPWAGYVSTYAYGALIVYFGVRLSDADLSSRSERWCLIGMGGLAGLAIWTNPLCLPYLIIGFGLLVRHLVRRRLHRTLLAKLALGLVALLVTASPVIITGVRYGLGALFGFRPSRLSVVPEVLSMTLTRYVTETFAVPIGPNGSLFPIVAVCITVLLSVLLVGFAVAVFKRDRRAVRGALVPLLLIATCMPFYLANPLAAKSVSRYFLLLFPLIVTAFAFPFALRRAWLTCTTLGALGLLSACYLAAYAWECTGAPAARAASQRSGRERLIEAAEDAGLRHVMEGTEDSHAFTWVARERVIFARPWGERYYPHLAGAIADDRAGFAVADDEAGAFRRTLEALDISFRRFSESGRTVFYGFTLPARAFRLIEAPAVALAIGTTTHSETALTDGDEETLLGRPYADDAALIIDLGAVQPAAALRIIAPNEWDYPAGYALSGSVDGVGWSTIQSVSQRATAACIYGNRLFHRGPDIAMECRFEPRPVRYLMLDEFHTPAVHVKTWRFTELFVYAECGERARPDEQEADEIARRLSDRGADSAFADPWLCAKLEASDDVLQALPYYSLRHPETHKARTVPIHKGVAFVVERAHTAEAARLVEEATFGEVELDTFETRNYIGTVIARAPNSFESFPGLKWNGFTVVRTARIATAAWYHERGVDLQAHGQVEQAQRCFKRSFETYPGIEANLRTLAPTDDKARAMLGRLTPAVEARCRFPYGISLVGYTLTPSTLAPGDTATLALVWELEGDIPYDYLPVFVHFAGGNTIRFQADHDARFPLFPRSTVPRCLVLDERAFTVPADCPPGRLDIRLGALTWWDRSRRLRPRTDLRSRDCAVDIGAVAVAAD